MDRRNIVLVTMDSLRADHCSFMGYERPTTPTLDEMARDGLVFENAVASGVPTIASMTGVMTGEYSFASPEIGFNEEQRQQVTSRKTLAEVLSEAGYTTGALSPNPPASSYFGFDEGFDWFEDFLGDDRGATERIWNRVVQRSISGGGLATYIRLFRNVVGREEVLRPWEDYYDAILEWCENAPEPYFLWILLLEPHHPWLPPKTQQQWSSRSDVYHSFRHYWEMLNSDWQPDFGPEERQRLLDLYDDSIRHGDQFLAHLRRDLRGDDPVFVVHADHGEEFGEHGRYGHQPHLYENLIHVPLVVSNTDASGTVSRPVSLQGLAPTIADIAGASNPFATGSLLEDGPSWAFSKVFFKGRRRLSIRTPEYKYIRNGDRQELYNLALDPDEQVDVVDKHDEMRCVFEQLERQHVASESERRSIDDAIATIERVTASITPDG